MHPQVELEPVDRERLTQVVQKVLGNDTISLGDWQCIPIFKGAGEGSHLYRFIGVAQDQSNERIDWSVILKIVQPVQSGNDPAGWHYWKRESLIYSSGLLDNLSDGITAARCFGVEDRVPDASWIWLEDITGLADAPWELSTFAFVARQLGRFNGQYLVGARAMPSHLWLSRQWLRGWTKKSAPIIVRFPDIQHSPFVRQCFPTRDMVTSYLRIWDERDTFLNQLAQLPQTFCHYDAFPRNLFLRSTADGVDQVVAIDWAFSGTGAVGEELAPLVLASISFFEVDTSQVADLERMAFDAYVEGLRDAGWQGDPLDVWLGYCTSSALRYGPGLAIPAVLVLIDPAAPEIVRQVFGVTMEAFAERFRLMWEHVIALADEARRLMAGS